MLIEVTTPEGSKVRVAVGAGPSLMQPLRDAGVGIAGTCGGAASCGTCHIVIAPAWRERLPAPSEEEADMLEALADIGDTEPGSRLACQIRPSPGLDGLQLRVAVVES